MTRRGRKSAWRITVSFIAGVVLTVGVAWGCVLQIESGGNQMIHTWGLRWTVDVPEGWPRIADVTAVASGAGARSGFAIAYQHPPGQFDRTWPYANARILEVSFEDAGWPLYALKSRGIRIAERQRTLLERSDALRWSRPVWNRRELPVWPAWPGFALNTAFYGAIVFTIWSAPGVVRGRIRLRRGLCVVCAYDLRGCGGKVCPECGA